jgi:hypothetical protein
MTPTNDPPMFQGQVIIEFRDGEIHYNGLPVPEAVYRFTKEVEEKNRNKVKNYGSEQ